MDNTRNSRIKTYLSFFIAVIWIASLFAGASDPPNFVLGMTIQYKDPQTKEQVVHEVYSYAQKQKTYQVPDGVELTLVFETIITGDNPAGDPASVDVWLDWTDKTPPPAESVANFECVPEDPGDCARFEETIKADANFRGSGGKGVYNVLIWVDRFDTITEIDEEDNIMGPVKIVATKMLYLKKPVEVKPRPPVLITPGKVKKSKQ